MRGVFLAGAVCAGLGIVCPSSLGGALETWTYYECVQDCRDNAPATMTLQQCIIERNCAQYSRPQRTYEDCVMHCRAQIALTGQTLQQCIAKYVCSQYPRE